MLMGINALLERTFVHIMGVGTKTERRIWQQGIETWDHFLNHQGVVFSPARDRFICKELAESKKHIHDIRFFKERLSSEDMWRVFEAFRDRAVYLDIETSGGYQGVNEITLIGIYDGRSVQTFINGKNLDQFESAICQYDLIITFNGSTFDLPFIRKWFRHISFPAGHIDLRFLLKRIGYRGSLKKIEKELGIIRPPEIAEMSGYDAVLLWKAYQWGDESALARLVEYNRADVVNLEPLMVYCYEEMKKRVLVRRASHV